MADLGDHAFSLALTVLGNEAAASDVAFVSVRRGGRSRVAVLAFARHLALQRAADIDPPSPTAVATVLDLASALTAARPAHERAVADLAGRHDLDRVQLGRALGVPAHVAGEQLATIVDGWARDLDPALLAWLGPGDCDELAGALGGTDRSSAEAALAVAPAVAAHVGGCELCTDRVRSMVSVYTLVSTRPLDPAPEPVRAAARRSRFRPPAPLPPPTDAVRTRRWPRAALLATVAAVVVGTGIAAAALTHRPSSQKDRVAVLTRVPGNGTTLTLSPGVVRVAGGAVLLHNTSEGTVHWHAASTQSWLAVVPADGILPPGGVVELSTQILPTAPEGDLKAPITVSGDEGSVAAALVETTVEHPPTVEATIDGCAVKATAEDESAIASVVLHWRDARHAEQAAPMGAGPEPATYLRALPSRSQPAAWWVTAVDSRGNHAQTPEQPAPAC